MKEFYLLLFLKYKINHNLCVSFFRLKGRVMLVVFWEAKI
jgi:hypothetical protein